MASPTETEVWDQIKLVVDLLEETRLFAESNAENWLALEDALIQALETDFAAELLAAVATMRSRLDGMLRDATNVLAPLIRQLGRTNNFAETDALSILARQFRYMIDTSSDLIQSRDFTFGTVTAAGGNTGNGTINRLTVDADNISIENQHSDNKTAKIIADMNTGAEQHEEIFQVYGQAPGRDALEVDGSGIVQNIPCLSARDTRLGNPSFSLFSGTEADPTDITDWTIDSGVIGDLEIDTTNFYRDFLGDDTPASLVFTGNVTISQKLSVRRLRLDPNTPYYFQLAYRRDLSAPSGGTLTINVGSVSRAISLTSGSGWIVASVPATLGQDNWPINFNEDDMDISIAVTGLTGGNVSIDDIIFAPFVNFDGSWLAPVGGSTRFLLDDEFTWNDSETGSKIQLWLWRAFGVYLPHTTGGGITITDP